jgi:hypothetical protein
MTQLLDLANQRHLIADLTFVMEIVSGLAGNHPWSDQIERDLHLHAQSLGFSEETLPEQWVLVSQPLARFLTQQNQYLFCASALETQLFGNSFIWARYSDCSADQDPIYLAFLKDQLETAINNLRRGPR